MQSLNSEKNVKRQYSTANNLNSRISLHQRFSTNKLGWANWVFQNYALEANQSVLELGCGNGGIWASNVNKVHEGVKLTLTDISEGMLEAARENTKSLGSVEYRVADAQDIPFAENSFDIVIANHMLYHVPDISKALGEISRVLKPDGIFYATTIGKDNMKELAELLFDFDERIDFANDLAADAFGLETGGEILRGFFKSVEVKRYEDSLHIPEAEPLVEYILSSQGIGNVNDIITGEKLSQFNAYVLGLFAKRGCIDIRKDAGMFISSNPVRVW